MKTLELTDEELEILQDDILTLIEDEEDNHSLSRDEDYLKELKALYKKLSDRNIREIREIPRTNDVYRHFKGNYYIILAVGHHSETKERMVVYYDMSGMSSSIDDPCIRPLDMFMSEVEHDKYPDVKQKYRFEKAN